jgi:hypothetical protein
MNVTEWIRELFHGICYGARLDYEMRELAFTFDEYVYAWRMGAYYW